jgi:hypothetical protein
VAKCVARNVNPLLILLDPPLKYAGLLVQLSSMLCALTPSQGPVELEVLSDGLLAQHEKQKLERNFKQTVCIYLALSSLTHFQPSSCHHQLALIIIGLSLHNHPIALTPLAGGLLMG